MGLPNQINKNEQNIKNIKSQLFSAFSCIKSRPFDYSIKVKCYLLGLCFLDNYLFTFAKY